MEKNNSTLAIFLAIFILLPSFVSADGWWGKGAKDKNWVLEHGGTLIYYQIKGKADPDKYKVRMYLSGAVGAGGGNANKAKAGDVIEMETGSKAVFDDAINNKYKIIVFLKNKEEMSKTVHARPGEVIKLFFDIEEDFVRQERTVVYPKNKIKLTSESAKYINASELRKNVAQISEQEKLRKANAQAAALKKEAEREKIKLEKELEMQAKIEKEKEEEKEREKEREEFETKLFDYEKEVDALKAEINQVADSITGKNSFVYFWTGPDRNAIESLETKLSQAQEKTSNFNDLKSKAPTEELGTAVEKTNWHLKISREKIMIS